MTSTYYINYEIRKSNGACAWLNTPHYETEAEARAHYEAKAAKPNVLIAHLIRCDHWPASELVRRAAERYPDGVNDYRILKTHTRI